MINTLIPISIIEKVNSQLLKKGWRLAALLLWSSHLQAQIISEICPSNSGILELVDSEYPDWIEIYNPEDDELNLSGFYLTDDISNPYKWGFPEIIIEDEDYVVLAASNDKWNIEVIPFPFSKEGGTLFLIAPDGTIKDYVTWPELQTNHSYGRYGDNWFYFDHPSPGLSNTTETAYKGYAETPTLNRPSGVHNAGAELILKAANEEDVLYYSLNGTNPVNANVYVDPLILKKTTTITAVAVADSLIPSPPLVKTLFVPEYRHQLPVVNLCLDSLILYDEVTGIFMLGPNPGDDFPYWGANYWSNRLASGYYQYFDNTFYPIEELPCQVKIHGGPGSRGNPMKSLQVRATNEGFNYPYFEAKPIRKFERLVLRNSGNDFCNTCVKDAALHNYLIREKLNVDLLASNPVVVYINGHYVGIQNMREKVDRYYLESNYGVDPDEVNLLEGWAPFVVNGSNAGFMEMKAFAIENDLSKQANYDWMAERLDIASFMDYFIIELYINNRDWPTNNLKLWNAPEYPKWRYIGYDFDAGFRYSGTMPQDINSLSHLLETFGESNVHVILLKNLLENKEFKRKFINRYCDLLNTTLNAFSLFEAFEEEKEMRKPDMPLHYEKWCGTMDTWEERFTGIWQYILVRRMDVYDELESFCDYPDQADIVVDAYPSDGGTIQLNTLELDRELPFYCRYITANSIDLEAKPAPGHSFLYWENLTTKERFSANQIQVNPGHNERYVAVFTSNEDNIFNLAVNPNPVERNCQVRFSLPSSGTVEFQLMLSDGRVVREVDGINYLPKGSHVVDLDLSDYGSGTYHLVLITDYGREAIQLLKL